MNIHIISPIFYSFFFAVSAAFLAAYVVVL